MAWNFGVTNIVLEAMTSIFTGVFRSVGHWLCLWSKIRFSFIRDYLGWLIGRVMKSYMGKQWRRLVVCCCWDGISEIFRKKEKPVLVTHWTVNPLKNPTWKIPKSKTNIHYHPCFACHKHYPADTKNNNFDNSS